MRADMRALGRHLSVTVGDTSAKCLYSHVTNIGDCNR